MTDMHPGWNDLAPLPTHVKKTGLPFHVTLRAVLVEEGRTQTAVAKEMGIGYPRFSVMIRGKGQPSLWALRRLTEVFPSHRQRLIDAALANATEWYSKVRK